MVNQITKYSANINCVLIKEIDEDYDQQKELVCIRDRKIASEMVDYMIISTKLFILAIGLIGLCVAIGY